MGMAAAVAVAKGVAVLLVGGSLVAVAAAVVVMAEIMALSLVAARGAGGGKPQKGTATVRSCRGCGVMAQKGVTPPSVMGVTASCMTMVSLARL